jgi:hypothetical protein
MPVTKAWHSLLACQIAFGATILMFIGDIYPGFTSTTQQPVHSVP